MIVRVPDASDRSQSAIADSIAAPRQSPAAVFTDTLFEAVWKPPGTGSICEVRV